MRMQAPNVRWPARIGTYESTLKALGIPYKTHKEYSDDVAEGKIISSSVNKTKAVVNSHISKRANQELTVVVSKGVRMATIPKDILDADSANGKDPLNALKSLASIMSSTTSRRTSIRWTRRRVWR